jgi:hypothetical protein
MHLLAAILILQASDDCVLNMDMNKSEEEMNADYSKVVNSSL